MIENFVTALMASLLSLAVIGIGLFVGCAVAAALNFDNLLLTIGVVGVITSLISLIAAKLALRIVKDFYNEQ